MRASWDTSYLSLPEQMYKKQKPIPVLKPSPLVLNTQLAKKLGVTFGPDWAEYIAGNKVSQGAIPLTQAYAGHQFGNWNPQLGDGRAVLLGEVTGEFGRMDIQLKGSGRTHWSRGGDGRAWLGPVLREYIVSEAMHKLGIPTTRALAAAGTGESIYREEGPLPGAVICRTAPSHIRVGTFQYFSSRNDHKALEALLSYTINRHYPKAKNSNDFLEMAVKAQAKLVAKWMGVGFIHGVMNTDNSHVAGITVDYGPCAFMDNFAPKRVFSAIDRQGRYAYSNQPNIAAWNMAQLATALLPLASNRDSAIESFTEIINGFEKVFDNEYKQIFNSKLGLPLQAESDFLTNKFLEMMAHQTADFTQSFRSLSNPDTEQIVKSHTEFSKWYDQWREMADISKLNSINPAIIPRNHIIEIMINQAISGNMDYFREFHTALEKPYSEPKNLSFINPPTSKEVVKNTFCGT